MKNWKRGCLFLLSVLILTGCGNNVRGRNINTGNSVNQVISSQTGEKAVNEAEKEDVAEEEKEASGNRVVEYTDEDSTVDYDLTKMSSDMVYVMVYQMMVTPGQYEGKTFRIEGNFYATYYEPTEKYYYYCIIQDATACCAQGMEFVWGDGAHVYPDEYPAENTDVIVEGTFETYREEGDDNLYCRLADATLTF